MVSIERAKTAQQLWDGRRVAPGKPVNVTVEQAADLVGRDADEWKIAAKADSDAVAAELKKRAAAAAPGGGN
jgi:hypothetical protein